MKKRRKIQYIPRKGYKIGKKEAQIVGNRIAYLQEKKGGEIQAEEVLEDAKSMKSPLHKHFEWNNTIAAQRFRLWQARQLLASIVEIKFVKGIKTEQRSFYNVINREGTPVYVSLQTVARNTNYIQQIIEECQKDITRLLGNLDVFKTELRKKK